MVIFLKLKYNIKIRQTATDPKNSPYIRNFGDPKKSRAHTTIKLLFNTTLNILEIDIKPKIILTGGLSKVVQPILNVNVEYIENLTLVGLEEIFKLNN